VRRLRGVDGERSTGGFMAKDEKVDEVKQLISLGKEKGYLTYDELNNALPADMVSSEQIDNLMMMFGEMDIEIIDTPEEERYQKLMAEPGEEQEEFKALEEVEEEVEEEEKVKEIDLTPGVLSRTADPVRLYLKEMGSVPLLSREGEIEIAKKIEEGEKEVAAVVFGTPMIIKELVSLGEKLRHGKVSLREMVSAFDEEFDEEGVAQEQDDEELTGRTLEAISKMRSPYRELMRAYQRLRRTGSDPAKRRRIKGQLREIKAQIAERIEQINLHPTLVEKMTGEVKSLAAGILQAEREITNCKRRLGVSGEEGLLLLKKIGRGPNGLKSVRRKTGLSVDTLHELEKAYREARKKIRMAESMAMVTADEIKEAVKLLEQGESKIKSGKTDLVEANLRLVVSIAKKYTNRGLQFLDLIQEGNIGLMKAVDKFEYKRGYKFSTYATWWIRQAITRAIADQARTIRIPVHMIETINKLIRTSRHLVQELGREPMPEEIGEKMDLPIEKVRKILKIAKEPISLETPIGEEEDSHLGDFIEDKKAVSPIEAAIRYDLQRQITNILQTLTPREERVLRKRFGIGENTDHTLEEVGQDFEVTRERIRQIEAKALRKLRHPSRSKKLKSFVESL